MNLRNFIDNYQKNMIGYYYYNEYGKPIKFRNYTNRLVKELLLLQKSNSIEQLFSLFYAYNINNLMITAPQENDLNDSQIAIRYEDGKNNLLERTYLHYSFGAGVWQPLENVNVLGMHQTISFQLGGKCVNKIIANFTGCFNFVNISKDYQVLVKYSLLSVNKFVGGYVGTDIERVLLNYKRNEISILAGPDYDGFTT